MDFLGFLALIILSRRMSVWFILRHRVAIEGWVCLMCECFEREGN